VLCPRHIFGCSFGIRHIKRDEHGREYSGVKTSNSICYFIDEYLFDPVNDIFFCRGYMSEMDVSKTPAEPDIQYMVSILELMMFRE